MKKFFLVLALSLGIVVGFNFNAEAKNPDRSNYYKTAAKVAKKKAADSQPWYNDKHRTKNNRTGRMRK